MRFPRPEPWFRKGDLDLAMARRQLEAEFYEDTAFHSQQAAEKYLKGLFIKRHGRWRRTHSCKNLLAGLAALGEVIPQHLPVAAEELDRHYLGSRYPNGPAAEDLGLPANTDFGEGIEYTRGVAETALATAEEIIGFVRDCLARPRRAAGATPDDTGPFPPHSWKTREAGIAYGAAGGGGGRQPPRGAGRPGDSQGDIARRFAAALSARLPVSALVLFGSRARGDHDPESDYDFVVVSECFVGQDFLERGRLPDKAWSAARVNDHADILCFTPAELTDLSSPLLWDALEEGIPILDAGPWAAALAKFGKLREAGTLVPIEDGWHFRSGDR